MLLQLTTSNLPLRLRNHSGHSFSLSLNFSNSISFPYGKFSDLTNFKPISCHKNRVLNCPISFPEEKKKPTESENWKIVFERICSMKDPDMGAGFIIKQWHKEKVFLSKWDLCRIARELREFGHYKFALEVYEWMSVRTQKFRFTTGDTAVHLELIARVRGIESAEAYFFKLPDSLKDERVYGALLDSYVRCTMKEKAESLMEKMKEQSYAVDSDPYNLMMILYCKLKNYDKIESVVSEMREKNIPLDIVSYNIWLGSRSLQGSVEKMEQVLEEMKLDKAVHPNWATYNNMATMYIRMGLLEKVEERLKEFEDRITGQDHIPYNFLIGWYGRIGKKQEVLRVWNIYKSIFAPIPNSGYSALISSLIRQDDIESAEKLYEEWLSVKSSYETRIGNLLLGWYVRQGFSDRAEAFYHKMIECGGNPDSRTWEIFAEGHIRERRISEALGCLKDAVSIDGSKDWRPKPRVVSSILEFCEQEGDSVNKDAMLGVLRQVGCLDDETYMSKISKDRSEDDNDDYPDIFLDQLQGSL